MAEVKIVNHKVLDQEPDTIVLIPDHPGLFIVGTYSLISTDDDSGTSTRRGSLQILSFSDADEHSAVFLDRKDFQFGIYDVNFHPEFRDILGVATSNGQVMIYRVSPIKSLDGELQRLVLQEVGSLAAEEEGTSSSTDVIVTQVHFLDGIAKDSYASVDHLLIFMVLTTQSGWTNLIKACISSASDGDSELEHSYTQFRRIHRQSFDLEAWTVLPLLIEHTLGLNRVVQNMVAISGGDDSQLLVSQLTFENGAPASGPDGTPDLDEMICTTPIVDKRTHGAGIVSTCLLHMDLPELRHLSETSRIFLTGSYDEKMRLFHLKLPQSDGARCEISFLSDFAISGGVWRIVLLHAYRNAGAVDFLLLIAGHTAGAYIIRLSCTPPNESFAEALESWHYSWKIEAHCTEHQSLVYAIAARGKRQSNMWRLVSTSFYDKLICEWEWEDREWRSQYSTV